MLLLLLNPTCGRERCIVRSLVVFSFEFQKGIVDVWATITEIRSKTEIKEKVEIVDRRKNGSNRLYQLMLVNGDDSTEPFWRDRTDLEFMVDKLDEFDATIDRKEALTLATTQVWGKR